MILTTKFTRGRQTLLVSGDLVMNRFGTTANINGELTALDATTGEGVKLDPIEVGYAAARLRLEFLREYVSARSKVGSS